MELRDNHATSTEAGPLLQYLFPRLTITFRTAAPNRSSRVGSQVRVTSTPAGVCPGPVIRHMSGMRTETTWTDHPSRTRYLASVIVHED